MAEITKVTVELSSGRTVTISMNDLSSPLKKKFRKEAERFLNVRKIIIEPILNEEMT